jgi:hypothetical protein
MDISPDWFKTKDYTIGICCFSAKYTALKNNVFLRLKIELPFIGSNKQ